MVLKNRELIFLFVLCIPACNSACANVGEIPKLSRAGRKYIEILVLLYFVSGFALPEGILKKTRRSFLKDRKNIFSNSNFSDFYLLCNLEFLLKNFLSEIREDF